MPPLTPFIAPSSFLAINESLAGFLLSSDCRQTIYFHLLSIGINSKWRIIPKLIPKINNQIQIIMIFKTLV